MEDFKIKEMLKRLMGEIIKMKERQNQMQEELNQYKAAATFVRDLAIGEGWNPPVGYVLPTWSGSNLEEAWKGEGGPNGSKRKRFN
jgi:hypothetical protein